MTNQSQQAMDEQAAKVYCLEKNYIEERPSGKRRVPLVECGEAFLAGIQHERQRNAAELDKTDKEAFEKANGFETHSFGYETFKSGFMEACQFKNAQQAANDKIRTCYSCGDKALTSDGCKYLDQIEELKSDNAAKDVRIETLKRIIEDLRTAYDIAARANFAEKKALEGELLMMWKDYDNYVAEEEHTLGMCIHYPLAKALGIGDGFRGSGLGKDHTGAWTEIGRTWVSTSVRGQGEFVEKPRVVKK